MSLRHLSHLNQTLARSSLRTTLTTLRSAFRPQTHPQIMHQSTATAAAAESASESALTRLWNSPIGPRTVHFWAPIAKWGVVIAGVSDMFRPAEVLSLQQNMALMATGAIWTRWCFVIKPKNLFLATVNFFLFCNGATQTVRVLNYRSNLNKDGVGEEVLKAGAEEGQLIKGVAQHPEKAVERAEKRTQ